MKINTIEIQYYKAFREVERLDIKGKNVLVYGNNGSGKTSIAHSLQALIQSSTKSAENIQAAFDRAQDSNVVNIDMPEGESAFTRITTNAGSTFEYSINGNTISDVVLQGANQVSDFINYRLLLRFFMFQESQDANIFPVIQDEFFPYWTDTTRNQTYQDWYKELKTTLEVLKANQARKNSADYKSFVEAIKEFDLAVQQQIFNLGSHANDFLKVYLSPDEQIEINIRFLHGFELGADSQTKYELHQPVYVLALSIDGKPINRPHTFLNEARLTALALALRFAAFEDRPKGVSDFKILVLDDLLISLDMSLRMKVIQALLDSYKDYQFFILTHDKGFYNFLSQALNINDKSWKRYEMYENVIAGKLKPYIGNGGDLLAKAKKYLDAKDYEVCAIYLRKKAEELVRIYYDPTLEELARFQVLENLSNSLAGVHAEHNQQMVNKIMKLLDSNSFTLEMVQKLKAEQFAGNGLPPAEVGQIRTLQRHILDFVENYYCHRDEIQKQRKELTALAQKVSVIRSIVLNPGAHQGDISIHIDELKDAYNTLKKFDKQIKESVKKKRNSISAVPS